MTYVKGGTSLIKYILFDLDGTLTDPKEGITKCVQYALKHFGVERDCDELVEFIGPPLKEHFMEYASLTDEEGTRAVELYRERYAPIGLFENGIYDGIIDLLSYLKGNGCTLAVSTSKPWTYSQKICDKYGISPYISYLAGSELDGTNTDKAAVIKKAMDYLGCNSNNTIMVGDRIHDCEGARKNGIDCVAVSYGYAQEGEIEKSGAIAVASSPYELKNILSEIIKTR